MASFSIVATGLRSLQLCLPGLLLVSLLTAAAYGLAFLPGFRVVGTLGIALLLGLFWRALFGLPVATRAGATFSARTLLRLGVVLLGVRLNFGLLYQAGPRVLLLALIVTVIGFIAMERLGKWLGLPRGLRFIVAIGSSVCGASAIAAAAPVVKASDDDVSVAVSIISLLGTAGVLGFSLLAAVLPISVEGYGLLIGSTLHEVAHVLAAGAAQGPHALDIATLTKLSRVALLAPVLIVTGLLLSYLNAKNVPSASAKRPPLLPGFLIGFLLVGGANSLGIIPGAWQSSIQLASLVLIAASMAGIGLGVDFTVLKRIGGSAAVVGMAGFVLLIAIAALYITFLTG